MDIGIGGAEVVPLCLYLVVAESHMAAFLAIEGVGDREGRATCIALCRDSTFDSENCCFVATIF